MRVHSGLYKCTKKGDLQMHNSHHYILESFGPHNLWNLTLPYMTLKAGSEVLWSLSFKLLVIWVKPQNHGIPVSETTWYVYMYFIEYSWFTMSCEFLVYNKVIQFLNSVNICQTPDLSLPAPPILSLGNQTCLSSIREDLLNCTIS